MLSKNNNQSTVSLKKKFEKWAHLFDSEDFGVLKSKIQSKELDPNETLINGLKPLHIACIIGNVNAVKFILEYAIETDSVSFIGKTALDEAMDNKNFQCAIEILNKKPKTHIKFKRKSEFQVF